jgi:hypothetical protein
MTKLGAAFVLALRIPNPPLLMFRCVMSVEYVGRSLVAGILSSCLKKDRMMLSIPCVRYPFQLYHLSFSKVGLWLCITSESSRC